jgi:hypothetical protein
VRAYLILSVLITFNLYAQTGVYDKNCDSYARTKENNFIIGTSEAGKRTERYFNWDKLSPAYGKTVQEVNQIAPDYYKNPRRPPIISCKESPCVAFRAYCTEAIAISGMKEEILKWRDIVSNCKNEKYVTKFPKHCDLDFDKSLNYIVYHSNQLAKAEQAKNSDAERYFREANAEFSKFRDNLPALIAMQKQIKEKEASEKKVKQMVKNCSDVVELDDNDVKGRHLADRVLNGLGACDADSLTTLKQPALKQLATDMDKILDKFNVKPMYDETNAIALKKSATAHWASHRQLVNGAALNQTQAIELICVKDPSLCKRPESKTILGEAYKENQALLSNVKYMDQEKTKAELTKFNAALAEINQVCHATSKENSANLAKLRDRDAVKNEYLNNRELNIKVQDNTRVVRPDYEKRALNEMLYEGVYHKVQGQFQALLQSPLGHLMMSKNLQDKVGVMNEKRIREKCLGSGALFTKPSLEDIESAKKDFVALTSEEIKQVRKNMFNPSKANALKEYLKNNPLTVAELLKNNPSKEYASAMCALIRQINDRDEFKQQASTALMWAGTVAAVALCATGVGAPVGAALLVVATGSTVINAANNLDDYFASKHEERAAYQSGATNQSELQEALSIGAKKASDADESLVTLRNDLIIEAAGFGAGKVLGKVLKAKTVAKNAAEIVDDIPPPKIDVTDYNQITKTNVSARVSQIDGNELVHMNSYLDQMAKKPRWQGFVDKIKTIRNREAPKLNNRRVASIDKLEEAKLVDPDAVRRFPDYGYSRIKADGLTTPVKSVEEAFEKFHPGQEFDLLDDGMKVIISPKNKVAGVEYVEIRYDVSGNYYRLQKGTFNGKKMVYLDKNHQMYTDWDGNMIDTRGMDYNSDAFIKLMQKTHWNASP